MAADNSIIISFFMRAKLSASDVLDYFSQNVTNSLLLLANNTKMSFFDA